MFPTFSVLQLTPESVLIVGVIGGGFIHIFGRKPTAFIGTLSTSGIWALSSGADGRLQLNSRPFCRSELAMLAINDATNCVVCLAFHSLLQNQFIF